MIYLVLINVIALLAFGIDKYKAKRGRWRISESTLLRLSFLGGGVGAYLGMYVFRHKTRHQRFRILVPISIILWAVIVYALYTMDYQG